MDNVLFLLTYKGWTHRARTLFDQYFTLISNQYVQNLSAVSYHQWQLLFSQAKRNISCYFFPCSVDVLLALNKSNAMQCNSFLQSYRLISNNTQMPEKIKIKMKMTQKDNGDDKTRYNDNKKCLPFIFA